MPRITPQLATPLLLALPLAVAAGSTTIARPSAPHTRVDAGTAEQITNSTRITIFIAQDYEPVEGIDYDIITADDVEMMRRAAHLATVQSDDVDFSDLYLDDE